MVKNILLISIVFSSSFILGQQNNHIFNINLGVTAIPLHINRTDAYRWMIYPSVKASLKVTEKINLSGYYLFQDIRLGKYPGNDPFIYSETPQLKTYDEALNYIGRKFGSSEFHDYIFLGISYYSIKKKSFDIQTGCQLGYRSGYTFVLSYVVEHPGFPNGFEIHPTVLKSNGPGINLFIAPGIVISSLLSVRISLGSFIFTKWPSFQPYGNMDIGVSF